MNRSTIILIFRILLGATFIFSGIVKLDSIYQFEQTIFKAGITNWALIPWLSRLLIGAEIFLGICFFHKEGLKKFTVPATFALLVIFCIHLGYTIITEGGNSGNCGCFGEKIPMTPIESLIKNIVMLAMLAYMYKVPFEKPAREIAIPVSLGIISFLFLFMFFPVKPYVVEGQAEKKDTLQNKAPVVIEDTLLKKTAEDPIIKEEKTKIDTKENKILKAKAADIKNSADKNEVKDVKEEKKQLSEPAKTTSKYAPFKNFSNGVTTDLDEGIKIVAMYNTGCEHCMDNAKQVCEISKKIKLPPVYILFWGSENEVPAFFEFSKCIQPYKILEPQVFFPLIGKANFPQLTLLQNGNIIGQWEGDDAPKKLEEAVKNMK